MSKPPLTAIAVKSFRPTDKQDDHWDGHVKGLQLRVSPGGTKTFNFVYRLNGDQRRLKLGRYPELSLAEARKRAIEARGELARGNDPAASRDAIRASVTFGELAAKYIENTCREKRSTREDQRMIAKDFLPAWESRKILTISPREIRLHIERIKQRGSRGVIANHCLSLLRSIFRFGVEHEFLKVNPCATIRRPVSQGSVNAF